jgi:1-hydroxycarotenoid 3,4-desaturase
VPSGRVVIVGAGVAGLVSALLLAARGLDVTVLEKQDAPGGKMREVAIGDARIDSGPTVFTMRRVFEEIFAEAGTSLEAHLTLTPLEILARHAWSGTERLDLFADIARSADAIGQFAGPAEARGYLAFCERARKIFTTLDAPFMRAPEPSMLSLVRDAGAADLVGISAFSTMWRELGGYFRDPRLRQLFGRYATYTGCSPYRAPASLMLIAHVEQAGVWAVEGGMHRLARVLAGLAAERGAAFRYGAEVREVLVRGGRACGVLLADGETVAADAVIVNADAAAVAAGLFGRGVAGAAPGMKPAERSLSALTFSMLARTDGFPLVRHNVFFSRDYAAEFSDLAAGRLPGEPTVYVCAQDRNDDGAVRDGPERLFLIVNAPANGDVQKFGAAEIEPCERAAFRMMERCGLIMERRAETMRLTTPLEFETRFPGTGGALYGRAGHGWRASFQRPFAKTKLPGLILAGGSAHPGAGVPMAAMSGRFAAACAVRSCANLSASGGRGSIPPSRAAAMRGGMSMR